jgi:hypothetical protein
MQIALPNRTTFQLPAKRGLVQIAESLTEQCGHKTFQIFLGSGRITGKPHLTRRWPFGRVTEGLPTSM